MNHRYYGDNLHALHDSLAAESVHVIYLDPPFNSKRDYNLLFKSAKGHGGSATSMSEEQIEAFEATWHWTDQAEAELPSLPDQPNTGVTQMIHALVTFLGHNDMTVWLVILATRLLALDCVLKPTDSHHE